MKMKMKKSSSKVKKAQTGDNLNLTNTDYTSAVEDKFRTRQYKRLGRLAAKKPKRAKKVAKRMIERATREERGEKYVKGNIAKLTPKMPVVKKSGGAVKKKTMKNGGTISPSSSSTSTRLSTYGRTIGKNTTGKAKMGAKMKKCKSGC